MVEMLEHSVEEYMKQEVLKDLVGTMEFAHHFQWIENLVERPANKISFTSMFRFILSHTGLTTFGGYDEPLGGRMVVIYGRFREIRSRSKTIQ